MQHPDPDEKLVKIFDTEHEAEAQVVKGLLDAMGIQSDLSSIDAAQETFPGVGGAVILVREEDAERARRIIEESKEAAAAEDTEDEPERP